MSYRVSVDVGGTFTDVVVSDAGGQLTLGKALTTPERSFSGFFAALSNAGDIIGVSGADLLRQSTVIIYGTTRATNAIVEGKTAKTALLVTEGFPDVLLYRQGGKERPFHLHFEYPSTYIPRKYTFEIPERIGAEGGVVTPLDEAAARDVIRKMQRFGIEAVAVCLLWSIVNPDHERRIGELLTEMMPGVPVTLSHQLNPIVREYPRASSASIDASLKPLMQQHLTALQGDLGEAGFQGALLISTSSGGVVHVDDVIERPIFMTKSGPAMAPLAGIAYSAAEGCGDDIIIVDTGGTTFDVSLARGGLVKYSRETWLSGKWIGHNLGVSTVDVSSIGAGGGSIAWVDSGGLLRVGPESAGSVPGPACYGKGGTRPTVTDAAVVLGFIDPEHFLGGRMKLDADAALRAVSDVAAGLGLDAEQTAHGIMRISGEQMIKAIEDITVNEGINPRESIIVAGGGAAGLNILPIADALGCPRVLVPSLAGGLSACGAQFSDIVTEHGASSYAHSARFDHAAINATLEALDGFMAQFAGRLRTRGVDDIGTEYFVECRYVGQYHELEIAVPVRRFASDADVAALVEAFHANHERLFTVRDGASAIECLNWKIRLIAPLDKPRPARAAIAEMPTPPTHARTIQAYFGGGARLPTPIFLGQSLDPGAIVRGPAVIEEPTTTVVVYPGMSATLTAGRNYLLTTTVGQQQPDKE